MNMDKVQQLKTGYYIKEVVMLVSYYLLFVICCFAEAGKSGGYFLRMVQSPRSCAMAETGTAVYGDLLSAISLNPALIALSSYKEVAFTYNLWIEDISLSQSAFVIPSTKKGNLAFSYSMLTMKPFNGYDNNGGLTDEKVSAQDKLLSINYAKRIYGPWNNRKLGFFLGGAFKYAKERIEKSAATTYLVDIGFVSINKIENKILNVGFSYQSLGQGFKFYNAQDPAPSIMRGGIALITPLYGDPFTIAFDFKKPNDDKYYYSTGIEYMVKRIFSARIGYLFQTDIGNGLRYGIGFNLKLIQTNYSLAKLGDFGWTHKIDISYKFGKKIEVTPYLSPAQEKARWKLERAKVLMLENKNYQAIIELNEAINLDPQLKEAIDLMKRARQQLETETYEGEEKR